VFGTFIYNGNAPGDTPFQRLVPIGLMWGNDPTKVITGGTLTQNFINPDLHIPQHLGYKGRLNGPVDNPTSSCLSCHSTAAISLNPPRPTINGIPPANPTSAQLKSYFRNIKAGTPFTPGYTSLDYSLQLQVGVANFVNAAATAPVVSPTGMPALRGAMSRRAASIIKPMERDGTPAPAATPRRPPHR
jgi:hypothetical protein